MAKPCSVCTHADVQTINAKLAQNRSYREITGRFQLSKSALGRHATACVADLLDAAREADAVENGVITEESVKEAWGKIRKQIDLADEWLTDPNDPTKYTLNPRADNVQVVYYDLTDKNEQGKPKRKHADLQELLYRLDKEGYDIDRVKLPKVDYTRLMNDAAKTGVKFLELLAKLRGELVKDRKNPKDREWIEERILRGMEVLGLSREESIKWLQETFPNVTEFKGIH